MVPHRHDGLLRRICGKAALSGGTTDTARASSEDDSAAIGATGSEAALIRLMRLPRLGVWLALIGVVLTAPSLFIGFHLDDYVGRYIYSDLAGAKKLYHVYVGGYGIATGIPAETHWQIEQGYAPWWTYPKLLIRLWRPLSLSTHLLDGKLWLHSAFMMHAQNVFWFALMILAATRLYRGIMGRTVGGLASILYAFDHTHGFPVGFICNRHALITAMFGSLALDQYCRGATGNVRMARWLGPFVYACALLSGEAGTSVLIYVAAYALFVEETSLSKRARAVLPYFLVTVLWRAVYTRMGYGASGSGLYIDPGREPLHFLSALLVRGPILLVGELFVPPSEAYMLSSPGVAAALLVFAVVFVLALSVALFPILKRSRVARFWCCGMVLSVVPASTTHPNNRLLFFCSLGAMGLLASLWELYAIVLRDLAVRGVAWFSRAMSALLVFVHLVVSPLALPVVACSLLFTLPIKRAFADVGPDVEGRDAIFVTAPDYYSVKLMPMQRRVEGLPLPRRWRVLSFGPEDILVRRTDSRTLVLDYDGGILSSPLMELYRDRRIPMAPGDTVTLKGLKIEVLEVTPQHLASEVRFAFDTSLDSPSFRFYYWAKNHFHPFTPPAIGASQRLPGARIDLGL